ncbi:EH domain-containing protein 1 [Smittium mucronatum]|uniref:EH domain-containing protein 1 n=1 Tax=Smittium mucronatum TaxID=133383 RepID=A0A1R0GME2_9FUNG|nr:EH domain-containing protein 1 [Smittium mucronatum]
MVASNRNKSMSEESESSDEIGQIYAESIKELQSLYYKKIIPLENAYNFEYFGYSKLAAQDIGAKPMVLLMGQYSTGKTTFLEYLLGEEYPGSYIGIEPTTDKFTAVMWGPEKKIIPGHAAAVSGDLPFTNLQSFGTSFLSRFQVSQLDNPLLKNITLIDSPGILSGSKQLERGYDFTKVISWFGERADLILILFDGHKLDISDEFRSAISGLRGQEEKCRFVLNKCDQVNQQQLMRVYGALMWSLGRVLPSPEVSRVYLGSFWPPMKPAVHNRYDDCTSLLEKEQKDLINYMKKIPHEAAIKRINDMVKRARQAKVHAYIIGHLKNEMPAVFGKGKKARELISNLQGEFVIVQKRYGLAPGDFPDLDSYKGHLSSLDFTNLKKLDPKLIKQADYALSTGFSDIMKRFPTNIVEPGPSLNGDPNSGLIRTIPPPYSALNDINVASNLESSSSNPFGTGLIDSSLPNNPASLRHILTFNANSNPKTKLIDGASASSILQGYDLKREDLRRVWQVSDWENRGSLDTVQFEVAMRLCERLVTGVPFEQAEDSIFRELGLR